MYLAILWAVKWPFQRLSDLQLGDKKVTLNRLVHEFCQGFRLWLESPVVVKCWSLCERIQLSVKETDSPSIYIIQWIPESTHLTSTVSVRAFFEPSQFGDHNPQNHFPSSSTLKTDPLKVIFVGFGGKKSALSRRPFFGRGMDPGPFFWRHQFMIWRLVSTGIPHIFQTPNLHWLELFHFISFEDIAKNRGCRSRTIHLRRRL